MNRLRRLGQITAAVIRYRLDTLIPRERLPATLQWALRLSPVRLKPVPNLPRGVRLRLALEALGPIFIKFGQMLSTRRDLLPDDVIDELCKLQDQVAPFPSAEAVELIEQTLGQPVSELFTDFDTQPLASASVAQVHAATLHSGQAVVVKVIRPGIETVIRRDIALLFTLARWLEANWPDGKRLRLVQVVSDYQHTILDELDLQREGANTSQLRRNFADSPLLYVPEVHWEFSRKQVLTLERIDGIPVTDIDALRQQGTDMQRLAERGVEIFFTQVLRDSFFHADMHPGNIFVSKQMPDNPQYIAIDCAIIGTLSESDQYYLARNLLAMFQRDYRLVAELHVECGWVPADTRIADFEAAIRSVCEPIFEKPIAEISFGKVLIKLFQTARRFNMEVQPSLVLLQKTLLHIEGLGRQLYPQLDLWSTAKPLLEQWLQQRYSAKHLFQRLRRKLPGWLEQLPQLPDNLLNHLQQHQTLQTLSDRQQQQIQQLLLQQQQRQRARYRQRWALLLAVGALLLAYANELPNPQDLPIASWGLLLVAGWLWLRR